MLSLACIRSGESYNRLLPVLSYNLKSVLGCAGASPSVKKSFCSYQRLKYLRTVSDPFNSQLRSISNVDNHLKYSFGRRFLSNVASVDTNGLEESSQGTPEPERQHRRTLDQVIYHLQADLRRRRRVHKADIHNGVELVEKAGRVESYGPFLLNCCCDILPDLTPEYRVTLAKRIWTVIQQSKEYSVGNFEAFLKALALNEDKSVDPLSYLDEAIAAGVEVTGSMYFFALLIVCQRGDLEEVVKILNQMKENDVPVNEKFFNVLMLGNARSGDLKGAAGIIEIMRLKQIEPSPQTWTTLLQAYIEAEDEPLLKETFLKLYDVSFAEDQFYELLKVAGRSSNKKIFDLVLEEAVKSQTMHRISVANVCLQLMFSGHHKNALDIILKFRKTLEGREPAGRFFIKDLHATNLDPEEYLDLIMTLQGDNQNPYALNIAAESCLKHKKFNLLYAVYEGMSVVGMPVRPHYFLPPFLHEVEQRGLEGAIDVLKRMSSIHIKPDWDMLLNWIIPSLFTLEGSIVKALKVIQETTGVSYASGLLSAGLACTLEQGRIEETMKIVESLKGKVENPDVVIQTLFSYITASQENEDRKEVVQKRVKSQLKQLLSIIQFIYKNVASNDKTDYVGALLTKLIDFGWTAEAETILNSLPELDISISQAALENAKNRLAVVDENVKVEPDLQHVYLQNFINGQQIQMIHPNDMDLSDLECHKEELEAKEMNVRGVYRKLFLKYCQTGDLPKAVELKTVFEDEFGELSSGMKAGLMENYIQNKMLHSALQVYRDILETRDDSPIKLDAYKVIDLAKLLFDKGCIDEGLEIIEEDCETRTEYRADKISRNVVRLLNALSAALRNTETQNKSESSESTDHVYRLTELFLKKGVIKPTSPTLNPSIRHLILSNKLEEAVARLETYSKKYHLTPGQVELTHAILINKPSLIERLMKASVHVRGIRNSKRQLAMAKADIGDLDGAAAIFRELGNDLNFVFILKQCDYLASKSEVNKLLNLITSLHKTGQNYDCNKLYELAIKSCQLSGDDEGLRKVLQNMQEHDMFISPNLKKFVAEQTR